MQTIDGNRHPPDPTPLQRRREFMEGPLEDRREIMRHQAEAPQQHYEDTFDE